MGEKCVPAVLFIHFVNLKAQKLLVTKEGFKTCNFVSMLTEYVQFFLLCAFYVFLVCGSAV